MRLKINLATRIYIDNRRLNLAFALVVAVLMLFLAFSIKAVATNMRESEKIVGEIASLEGKSRGNVGEKEYQEVLTKIGAANSIITGKTYNWLALLDKLEAVVPDGVALTAIQPDPKAEGLKLNGVAGNFQALRRFVENLEDAHTFTDVYLLAHNEAKVGATQSGITFMITCKVTGK